MISQEANPKGDNAYSVLRAINQKETEIRQQVAEAQQRAAALVQAAREDANQMLAQADQEARVEAERIYQSGLKEANEKAETLLSTAQERAASLRQLAQVRLDEAVSQLVKLILPEQGGQAIDRPRADSRIRPVAETTGISKGGN
jgi:vacuolar-type H+-ATPase subunit H